MTLTPDDAARCWTVGELERQLGMLVRRAEAQAGPGYLIAETIDNLQRVYEDLATRWDYLTPEEAAELQNAPMVAAPPSWLASSASSPGA